MISHVIVYPWVMLIALPWGLMAAPKLDKEII